MRHHGRVRGLRRAAAPAAWLASTAVAAGVAWWAVSAAGAPGQAPDVLSEAQVAGALAAERDALAGAGDPTTSPGTSASPGPSAGPTPDPTPTGPAATPVVRTWSFEGGTVSTACSGDVVSLEYATPAGGWRVDVKERGPGARVLVELERSGVETYVQAVCVDGTPEYGLVADDSGGDGGTGGTVGTGDPTDDHRDDGGDSGGGSEGHSEDHAEGADD